MSNVGLVGDAEKLLQLRQWLGWTQDEAAEKSGYTSGLIRSLEAGGTVKPSALLLVLHCYHEAREERDWRMADFLAPPVNAGKAEESAGRPMTEPNDVRNTTRIAAMKHYFEMFLIKGVCSRFQN